MDRSDGESCGTDYDTDGFWSSEKTLLESVRAGGDGCRRRTKKKKKTAAAAAAGKDSAAAAASKDSAAVAGKDSAAAGLRLRWRDFLREHDDEWRGFRTIGRKCFVDVVRPTGYTIRAC